jgi:hypothetical protein
VKVAQPGRPLAESAGVGMPVAFTVNDNGVPTETMSVLALVIAGACATWMVKVFLVVVLVLLSVL